MQNNKIVSRNDWIEPRKQLLKKEKEFTRLRDQLAAEPYGHCTSHTAGRSGF